MQQVRFAELDALRGVSALVVVLFHSYNGGGLVPNGFLVVDLFFVLSGFVIVHSYEKKLLAGMSVGQFMLHRAIRLYPMLIVGALGGLAIALAHKLTHSDNVYTYAAIWTSGLLSTIPLPYLVPGSINNNAFSFNPVIWSLFFELFANLFYAQIAVYFTRNVLIAIVVTCLMLIAIFGLGGGSNSDFWLGFPRVGAGFFAGVLLYRWRSTHHSTPKAHPVAPYVIIVLVVMYPNVVDYVGAAIGIVLMIAAVTLASARTRENFLQKILGQLSYPVYLLHWLTLYVATAAGKAFGLAGDKYWIVVTLHLTTISFIGFFAYREFERPVMELLKRKFLQA